MDLRHSQILDDFGTVVCSFKHSHIRTFPDDSPWQNVRQGQQLLPWQSTETMVATIVVGVTKKKLLQFWAMGNRGIFNPLLEPHAYVNSSTFISAKFNSRT